MSESNLIFKLDQVIHQLTDAYHADIEELNHQEKDSIIKALIELYLLVPEHAHESLILLIKQHTTESGLHELIEHDKQFQAEENNQQLIVKQLAELLEQVNKQAPRNYQHELRQTISYVKDWAYEQSDYEQVLPIVEILHAVARNGIVEEQAYKLSAVFGGPHAVIQYLEDFAEKYHISSENLLHDASIFSMPQGQYDAQVWRELAVKHHDNPDFFKLISSADAIERHIRIHEDTAVPDQNKIAKLENKIAEKQAKGQDVTKLQIELVKANDGAAFNANLSVPVLRAVKIYYKQYSIESYQYFLDMGLSKYNYDKFSSIIRQDNETNIPSIKISAQDIGYVNKAKYYLMKIPILDEMHATRAACLGLLTNCTQSMTGDVCESCVIHGLSSVYAGFYTICAGDINNPKVSDPVIAQTWAWRSKNDAIIFDSIEISKAYENEHVEETADTFTIFVSKMFLELAEQLVLAGHTHHVAVGTGSGIQRKLEESPLNISLPRERFIDYDSYSDSNEQVPYIHMTQSGYILYEASSAHARDFAEINHELITRLLQDSNLYFNNFELIDIMETVLKLKGNANKSILESMNKIAKQEGRGNEFKTMLNKISQVKEALQNNYAVSDLRQIIENDPALINISNQSDSALLHALKFADADAAIDFIKMGSDIHFVDAQLRSPLMLATQLGLDEIVEELLKRGADTEHICEQSLKAMEMLPRSNRIKIWKIFQAYDVPLYRKNYSHHTLLSQLMEQKKHISDEDLADAKYLLDYGINPNLHGHLDEPLLIQAFNKALTTDETKQNNALQLVLELVNHGSDLNNIGVSGDTPLMNAIRFSGNTSFDKSRIINVMLARKDLNLNARNPITGNSALNVAIKSKNQEIALLLIEAGCDLNIQEKDTHFPALVLAIENDMPQIAAQLIDHGADLSFEDEDGKNLIMIAIKYTEKPGYNKLVHKLITSNQIDLNAKAQNGKSAFHLAIDHNSIEIVKALSKNGADMNIQDSHGDTPMHYAIIQRNERIAIELVTLGAFIAVVNHNGMIPLDLARQAALAFVVEYIEKPFAVPKSWLEAAVGGQEAEDRLLDKVEQQKVKQWIENDDVAGLINFILENKGILEKNIMNGNGPCSLLMYACEMGSLQITEWLIRLLSNINEKDAKGNGLVEYTLMRQHANQFAMLELLRKNEVDLNISRIDAKLLSDDVINYLIEWHLSGNEYKNLQRKYSHDLVIEMIQYDEASKLIAILKNNGVVADSDLVEKDLNECSLLQYACKVGAIQCVKALLDYRATVNHKDRHGRTALDYTLNHNTKNQLEILKALRQARVEYPIGKFNPNDYTETVSEYLAEWQRF